MGLLFLPTSNYLPTSIQGALIEQLLSARGLEKMDGRNTHSYVLVGEDKPDDKESWQEEHPDIGLTLHMTSVQSTWPYEPDF